MANFDTRDHTQRTYLAYIGPDPGFCQGGHTLGKKVTIRLVPRVFIVQGRSQDFSSGGKN